MDPHHIGYVDVATSNHGYVAAIWGSTLGCRFQLLPYWVRSQQSAEVMAIEGALKVAACMKLPAIYVGADNLAAIGSAIRLLGVVATHTGAESFGAWHTP